MQTKLNVPSKPSGDINFPVLAKAIDLGHVVLFTSTHEGFVLHKGDSDYHVGTSCKWWTVADYDVWEILPQGSSVELVQGVTHG